MHFSRYLFVLLALVITCVAATDSVASRRATVKEKAKITRAIVASVKNDFPAGTKFPVTQVRISTVNDKYARAAVGPPTKNGKALTDRATIALKRIGTSWRVLDLGTSGVGCKTLPAKVYKDLFGHAYCP